jgi:phospho-N-acetylmuramoyl-pentapeptide-transferase
LFSVVLAAAVAFLVTVLLGSKFIEFLQSRKFGQFVREEGPQTHLIKAGTPTMGGIVMLTGLLGALLVVARPNVATLTTMLLVAGVAGIGLYDDWQKISKKRPEGLSARYKFLLLTLAVVLADILAVRYVGVTQTVLVPYFDRSLVLGPGVLGIALFSVFLLLVIAGTTNAVNLTDGLDGLAAGAGAIALLAYTAIAFLERQYDVAVICGAMVGAIVGFLWYNSHPDLHGGHGRARDRRRPRRGCGADQDGAPPSHRRWTLRDRGALRYRPGPHLQAHGAKGLQDGPDSSPLRVSGVG